MKGLHIIADLYNCQKGDLLFSSTRLRELCVNACRDAGLTVLGDHFYQFDGIDGTQQGGSTGAVVLAESHLAIHTWPERDGATLDVYVCNYTADNTGKAEAVYKALVRALKPGDVLVERIQRGRDLPLKKRVANG
ncbi:MAG TPA: adenosylmethionine decarboxylase [Usitatibacter sp.]|nr:adenosylmethionine decarboxylase [Usitatibacter sp.]